MVKSPSKSSGLGAKVIAQAGKRATCSPAKGSQSLEARIAKMRRVPQRDVGMDED
jgi:hypothetical protein